MTEEGNRKTGRKELQAARSDVLRKGRFVFHMHLQSFCKPWRKESKTPVSLGKEQEETDAPPGQRQPCWGAQLSTLSLLTHSRLTILQMKPIGSGRQNREILFQSDEIDEQTGDR